MFIYSINPLLIIISSSKKRRSKTQKHQIELKKIENEILMKINTNYYPSRKKLNDFRRPHCQREFSQRFPCVHCWREYHQWAWIDQRRHGRQEAQSCWRPQRGSGSMKHRRFEDPRKRTSRPGRAPNRKEQRRRRSEQCGSSRSSSLGRFAGTSGSVAIALRQSPYRCIRRRFRTRCGGISLVRRLFLPSRIHRTLDMILLEHPLYKIIDLIRHNFN